MCFINLPFIKLAVTISCGFSMIGKGRVLGSRFHTWKSGYVMSFLLHDEHPLKKSKGKFTKEGNGLLVEEN